MVCWGLWINMIKDKRKLYFFVGVFLVGLVGGVFLLESFYSEDRVVDVCEERPDLHGGFGVVYEGGCVFYKEGSLWKYYVDYRGVSFDLLTAYLPSELDDIKVSGELSDSFIQDNGRFYFSHESDSLSSFVAAGSTSLLFFFDMFLGVDSSDLGVGCLNGVDCLSASVVSCDSFGDGVGVVEFRVTDGKGGRLEFVSDGCIVVSGSVEYVDRVSQYLIFDFVGIF